MSSSEKRYDILNHCTCDRCKPYAPATFVIEPRCETLRLMTVTRTPEQMGRAVPIFQNYKP